MLRATWVGLGLLLALALVQMVHFALVMAQSDQQTNDGRYFAMSRDQRAAFRARLRRHSRLLSPFFWLLGKVSSFKFPSVTFRYQDVPGPKGACDEASFARGAAYRPQPEDVFVVTPMKCGTTWMQHLVYQLATRGANDLASTGTALYHLSPWLESRKTVPAEQGPRIGNPRPLRLIKTHFPTVLCPYSDDARYVYVIRHPVSCFASCVDFLASNLGGLMPPLEEFEQWFCSRELMWWLPWPQHAAGWWRRSQTAENVLFVRYEDMKEDLRKVAVRVQSFLELPELDEGEMSHVLQYCSFDWMSRHFDLFEMQVPHLLQDAAAFFKSGRSDRFRDVPADMAERIVAWCEAELQRDGLSLEQWYPSAEGVLA